MLIYKHRCFTYGNFGHILFFKVWCNHANQSETEVLNMLEMLMDDWHKFYWAYIHAHPGCSPDAAETYASKKMKERYREEIRIFLPESKGGYAQDY